MHVTVKREALLRPLAVTHRVVERRNTIPILSNLRLGTELQALTIRGTDLDIEAAAACEADVVEPGALTLPAHILRDIVGKLPQGADVTLRAEANGQLALTAGRSRFKLPTLPVEDYPDLQTGELPHRFVVPVADIVRTIAACGFAISTDETRYYLNGVYWHAEPDGIRSERLIAVATDGHRLSRLRLPLPEGAEGMPGVILPRKLIEQLAELCKGEGAAFLDVALSPTKVRFGRDGASLTSKLIDGTFPDYKRVIPDVNATILLIDGRAVAQALDRVSSVSSERGRAVKLDVAAEGLTLSQKNPDLGEGVEAIDATLDGAPLSIGFNGKYLKEVLDVLDSETVEMVLDAPGSPTILRRRGDALNTVVLMPMRV